MQHRLALAPFVALLLFAAASGPAAAQSRSQVKGEAILKHPAAEVALKYVDLVHGGKMDEALKLASTRAQANWKALPASERAASARFRKKILPSRADLEAGIRSGGLLNFEGDKLATLNVVKVEQKSAQPGTVQSTSATVALPLVLEGGQWKLAQ